MEQNLAFNKSFGQVIRGMRQNAGRSQEDVAAAVGISTYYVRELELGRRNPSLAVILRLAATLGVQPHRLLEEAEASEVGEPK